MAKIEFPTVKKPLEDRIQDAACIYWDVTPDFFKMKRGNASDVEKRQVFFYLLQTEAMLSLEKITEKYGIGRSNLSEAKENIESKKVIYRTLSESIREIMKIAENLQSVMAVTADIKLQTLTGDNS